MGAPGLPAVDGELQGLNMCLDLSGSSHKKTRRVSEVDILVAATVTVVITSSWPCC
jgi:hypothetical protein